MARLQPLVDPKNPPEKVDVGSFFSSFPRNETHTLFSGGPQWVVLGGGQKVYVENVYVLFLSLIPQKFPRLPAQRGGCSG